MEALPFYYGQVNQRDLEKNDLNWDELGKGVKIIFLSFFDRSKNVALS